MAALTAAQLDRACGVLLATAAGDALGAGYEFGQPLADDAPVSMVGGGGFEWDPGEWTDDTSMAIAIAEVAATGADLRELAAQDAIVTRWEGWAGVAKDVGHQTRKVLSRVDGGGAVRALAASRELHQRTGRTAGNGNLMRTAPVALAYLAEGAEADLADAAASMSALTHYDTEAGEAAVLWCLAIRHAVLTGEADARVGLELLTPARRSVWATRIDVAERSHPGDFANNGWVVEALQAAWCAISTTPIPTDNPVTGLFRADHLRRSLENAVRGGRDADTVAAIAGGLLGAKWGASAVPAQWRAILHGWPGMASRDLIDLVGRIVRKGAPDGFDFTYTGYAVGTAPVPHPHDEGVLLGDVAALRSLPDGIDAVVSLCRVGDDDAPDVRKWVEVRLIDRNGVENNPHLDFVLRDTVSTIQRLRSDGHAVLVHCVQAHSRTPTVAALYGARVRAISGEQALADVLAVLPHANPIADFRAAVERLAGSDR